MRNIVKSLICALIFVFIFTVAFSKELSVNIKGKSVKGKVLYVTVDLDGNISYDTIEAIKNGITAKIYVTVQLLRSGGFINISQGTISQKTIAFTISYDVWENKFILKSKKLKKMFKLGNPAEIISSIEKSINPIVLSIGSAKSNYKLILRSKLEIQTIKLYPPFGIFLYFFDPWNYETKWTYSKSFTLKK